MKIKPVKAWGFAMRNGNRPYGLTYAVTSTRRELFARWPHIRRYVEDGSGKAVRIELRPL